MKATAPAVPICGGSDSTASTRRSLPLTYIVTL
jgi:hypothetical protein